MNSILNALENSPLANLFSSSQPDDVYSYGSSATNSSSIERIETVISNPGLSQTTSIEIPKIGILESIVLKVSVTETGAVNPLRADLAASVLDFMELHSSNRTIARMDQKYLSGLASAMPNQTKDRLFATIVNPTVAAGGSGTAYIPFLFELGSMKTGDSAEKSYRQCLDTKFVETLSFRYRLKAAADWQKSGTGQLDSVSVIMYFRAFQEEVYRSIEETNFASGPLQIVNKTQFSESAVTVASGATTVTVPLNTNGLVTRTFIKVIPDSEDSGTGAVSPLASEAITKVTFNANGRQVFEEDGPLLKMIAMSGSQSSGESEEDYVIDYEALKQYDYSGGVSFRELAGAELVLTFAAIASAGKAYVTHEQVEVLTVNPANGRIQVSLSS